jgi:hypothetical protein
MGTRAESNPWARTPADPGCFLHEVFGARLLALLAFMVLFVVSGGVTRVATRPVSADAWFGIGVLLIGAAGSLDRLAVQRRMSAQAA